MIKKSILCGLLGITSIIYAGQGKINAEIQIMNGKAGEYVYDPETRDKVSYLNWKIKNVPMLKLGYDYSVNNFEFSINGRKNISNNYRSGYMKDYDWFSTPDEEDPDVIVSSTFETEAEAKAKARPGDKVEEKDGKWELSYLQRKEDRGKLSNFSKNKNYVKNIMGLDLSVKYYLKNTEKIKFAPVIGLNYDKYEFYALGGDQKNFIPDRGYFVGKGMGDKVITYKQRFISPYIGFVTTYTPNSKWEINFAIKGTTLGRTRAIDRHLKRGSMETVEKYKNMKYLSSNLAVKYNWNENLSINLGVEAVKYFKNRKSTVRFTPEEVDKENTIETVKNIAGLKNYNVSYSFGFEYKF